MDKQEYLNQISAQNRPVKSGGTLSKIFTSKLFFAGIIVVVLIIALMIFGSMLGSGKSSEPQKIFSLNLHIDNTISVISQYQRLVKSSVLRSSSTSLSSVLSNTKRDLGNFIPEKSLEEKTKAKLTDQANLERDGLIEELFEAKINGNLDRVYAHKMAYEISTIATEETTIINSTKNADLKEILTTSYNSLNNLYDDFNNFSETK